MSETIERFKLPRVLLSYMTLTSGWASTCAFGALLLLLGVMAVEPMLTMAGAAIVVGMVAIRLQLVE